MTTKSSAPKSVSCAFTVTSRNSERSHTAEAMCSAIFLVPPVGEKVSEYAFFMSMPRPPFLRFYNSRSGIAIAQVLW